MKIVFKILISSLLLFSFLNASDYRAYGIGGDLESSKSQVTIAGEVYTLLPFSSINVERDDINKDGDYCVLVGELNGKKITPIKIASNYKNNYLSIKVFKGTDDFSDSNLVSKSEEIYTDDSYKFFAVEVQ